MLLAGPSLGSGAIPGPVMVEDRGTPILSSWGSCSTGMETQLAIRAAFSKAKCRPTRDRCGMWALRCGEDMCGDGRGMGAAWTEPPLEWNMEEAGRRPVFRRHSG